LPLSTQANHDDFHFKTLFFTEGRNIYTAESATFAVLATKIIVTHQFPQLNHDNRKST